MNLLNSIVREVRDKHKFHTLILYGSWARGDANAASDYDLLAVRKSGINVIHDARKWRGAYLDLFVYPESKAKPSALMRVRGGKVLVQRDGFGDRLLSRVDRLYARGPKPLPSDEREPRRVWARKMLDRAKLSDAEGNFRRVWLLTALLEDYFVLRNRWYEGPKASFQWLRENQPKAYARFERALQPGADITAIETLVESVIAQ